MFGATVSSNSGLQMVLIAIGVLSFIGQVFMLVHAIRHAIPNKALWIVLLILINLSWVVYFFVVKKPFDKGHVQAPAGPTPAASAPPSMPTDTLTQPPASTVPPSSPEPLASTPPLVTPPSSAPVPPAPTETPVEPPTPPQTPPTQPIQ